MPRPLRDWLLRSQYPTRVECIEAYFGSHGFDPHRHDTYAIGRTLSGVQSFRYRQQMRHGVPGSTLALHPDEVHDRTGRRTGRRTGILCLTGAALPAAFLR
ncbi:hypothetical protein HAQ06_23930 [Pseudomonas sp. C2L12B]|nr:hypothetical protein [Pseudomonas typographi]MBD1589686.1 hypothetical protein [Pseudomonas typographi]